MADTDIEWATKVWNFVRGCRRVSPGCGGPKGTGGCYAEKDAWRFHGPGLPYEGLVEMGAHGPRWTGKGLFVPEKLAEPMHVRPPTDGSRHRFFVNSMSDLFHERVPDEFIFQVLNAALQGNRRHTYQVLTKRPERMARWFAENAHRFWHYHAPDELKHEYVVPDWPDSQLWLGTSIENDRYVGRADALRETPAAVRFISAEPLLGPLPSLDLTGIDWLIVGGESGPGHRPMDPEWVRDLVERADATGVAVFVKQASGAKPGRQGNLPDDLWARKEYPR